MHELGIMIHIVKQIEDYMDSNHLREIKTLTLEIGEISGIVPKYLTDIYPLAVEQTRLEHAELVIEEIKAKAFCKKCHTVFDPVKNEKHCPKCSQTDYKILSGAEFNIKNITAY